MSPEEPATFTTTMNVAYGHEVTIVTEAASPAVVDEKRAERIHTDLQARAEKLDVALTEDADIHPDDAPAMVMVNWAHVLGFGDQAENDDGGGS